MRTRRIRAATSVTSSLPIGTSWSSRICNMITPSQRAEADVLNGIAYDAARNRLFVTGKLFPKLFEIRLKPGR